MTDSTLGGTTPHMKHGSTTFPKKTVYIRVDPPLHRRAKVLAAKKGVSLEDIGRAALAEYLDRAEATKG